MIQNKTTLVDIVKCSTGLAILFTTLPIQVYLIARDIMDDGRYSNRPETIFYNKNRPTPNYIDFTEGKPEANRSRHFYQWLKTFVR